MNTFIIFLRGINVGGHKKIKMADLRNKLQTNGFANVKTYIQSGNIVCKSTCKNTNDIEYRVSDIINNAFGYNVPVIAKTHNGLQSIVNECPFLDKKKEKSHFILFQSKLNAEAIKACSQLQFPNEEFLVTTHCAYTFCKDGYSKAKCGTNFFEQKLNLIATARNYKTMMKLLSLSAEP